MTFCCRAFMNKNIYKIRFDTLQDLPFGHQKGGPIDRQTDGYENGKDSFHFPLFSFCMIDRSSIGVVIVYSACVRATGSLRIHARLQCVHYGDLPYRYVFRTGPVDALFPHNRLEDMQPRVTVGFDPDLLSGPCHSGIRSTAGRHAAAFWARRPTVQTNYRPPVASSLRSDPPR